MFFTDKRMYIICFFFPISIIVLRRRHIVFIKRIHVEKHRFLYLLYMHQFTSKIPKSHFTQRLADDINNSFFLFDNLLKNSLIKYLVKGKQSQQIIFIANKYVLLNGKFFVVGIFIKLFRIAF